MRRIDTLLLLALPASGKSELRRYLASLDDEVAARDFGLGPRVELDDYPYVHLMRRLDAELARLDGRRVFYDSDDHPFRDGRDWATLIRLINQDFASLGSQPDAPAEPTHWLLDRLQAARVASGIDSRDLARDASEMKQVAARLDSEVAAFAGERAETLVAYQPGRSTVVIEFARGGRVGAESPLAPPHGYAFSLSVLSAELLRRAAALYVWVTPEESRRRNRERAVPGPEGDASILHHGVPERVMVDDYGCDDFLWLLEQGGGRSIQVDAAGGPVAVPAVVFDNRTDHTSFLRADPTHWDSGAVRNLHLRLEEAFTALA